jgi:succinate dehydrogenase / fumarate reductase cytochrome b subunit
METAPNSSSKCSCRLIELVDSSIGKKIMVALAGLLLCGFLITHLAGNLFLFVGATAFNRYAEFLESQALLPLAEGGLLVLFLIHIALSIRARLADAAARPIAYEIYKGKDARTPGSRTMAVSGSLILLFIVIHVATIKYQIGGAMGTTLYDHVTGWFRNPLYAGFYVLAMIGIGLHLSHGVQSAFQTFGVSHPRYTPLIKKAGLAFAVAVALAFASMPIYFGFIHNGGAK